MPLADLVDASTLSAALAAAGLGGRAEEAAIVPRLASAASAAIRAFCRRDFTVATYDELYEVTPARRSLTLRQYPVVSVARVATGLTPVLEITNTSASVYRATAALVATAGSTTPTGLAMVRHADGQATSNTITFGVGVPLVRTVAQLAAQVLAAGNGWTATVVDDFGAWAVTDLRPVQGAQPAKSPAAATLRLHAEDLAHSVDERLGMLYVGPAPGGLGSDERWGPGWPGEESDRRGYGGATGVRVVYEAGYATIPADVVQAAVETVKAAVERLRTDATLVSESDGQYSYTVRDPAALAAIPTAVQASLASHVSHRA